MQLVLSRVPQRRGFTLVELLVVIAIIGILVALLLPAIQAAREAGRRMSCSNKLHQVGVALHNYHDVHQTFPPDAIWTRRNRPPSATAGEERNFTWIALVLPFIEQKPLHDQIDFSLPALNQVLSSGQPLKEIVLESFLCPSDTVFRTLPHNFGYTSYAASAGWDAHRRAHGDERIAGMFPLLDAMGIRDVRDGTSNTILLAEVTNRGYCCNQGQWRGGSGSIRVGTGDPVFRSLLVAPSAWVNDHVWITDAGGPLLRADGSAGAVWGPWAAPHGLPPIYYAHYAPNVEWPGAGSPHPSGILACLVDGSVRFVADSIATGDGIPAAGIGPGDAYGRGGNVWSGAHYPQGIPDKSPVVWP